MPRELLTLKWRGKSDPVPDLSLIEIKTAPATVKVVSCAKLIEVSPPKNMSPLDICLSHWVNWMRDHDDRDLGAKNSAGIRSGVDDGSEDDHAGYDDDGVAEAAIARMSREIAMATDVSIESLPGEFRSAIKLRCNMATKWQYKSLIFGDVLAMAEAMLVEKLSRNIATRIFW